MIIKALKVYSVFSLSNVAGTDCKIELSEPIIFGPYIILSPTVGIPFLHQHKPYFVFGLFFILDNSYFNAMLAQEVIGLPFNVIEGISPEGIIWKIV